MTRVGIDAMYVHTPELYVDNSELAIARNEDPKHFVEGIGIKSFSVAPPNEDQASMAATAAYRLMESYNISPSDIFRIDTPTESGLDASRALVSDVVGMLEQVYGRGSFSHLMGYEQKFACVSGMERLLDSSAWFAAGWNSRKYALVLVTDIAKYELRSKEEPTQGAAAAALLIGENPRLLEIIPHAVGSGLRNERGDFKKPGGRTIALVDTVGKGRSYAAYLSEMKQAWLNFSSSIKNTSLYREKDETSTVDLIDRAGFHNPHKKMVISAYASLLIHEWRNRPKWSQVVSRIGPEPPRGDMDDLTYYMSKEYNEFRRKFMALDEFNLDFERKVGSSLIAPELIGNSYAASVFVGLDSIFENDKESLSNKILALCGYGSGSHALIQATKVAPDYDSVRKKLDLMNRISQRRKLSIQEYEEIHQGLARIEDCKVISKPRFVLVSVGQKGTTSEGDRDYSLAR
ncbi:MAG: hydroxymethylglutaryl-CoA synthase family protein [Nitrososphaerota archaeon]|jgi:hydroxymethylglutaryl-CoA synthase|nr:hydroxymethylglutaryl-CoA synthase family protein [Nitrososphaerota archaeon]